MNQPNSKGSRVRRMLMVLVALAVVGGMTLLSAARSPATFTVTITNNSQLQIRGLYLAPGDPDNWGPDQLNGSTISPGASQTINVSCDGSSLRVITEDQNGCFLYHSVSCDGNQTWTITDSESPDCGS